MQFNTLSVKNFGVFRGRHDFNLQPVSTSNARRPLVVISGHNGAGKSTLFQAIGLALYGSLQLGDRVSQQDYNDFLLNRFHRHPTDDGLFISDESSILLSCNFTISGKSVRVQIERRWKRTGQSVAEELQILEDGHPPDVPPEDYQTWLSDLVPHGLDTVIFFDAEQLDALSSPEHHEALLEQTLRRLLGLNLVKRLVQDLSYYVRQQGSGENIELLRNNVLQRQAELEALDEQLAELQAETEALEEERSELQSRLAQEERRLAAEGGTFAERRQVLQEQLRHLEREVEGVSNQLRDLCADLLPFSLTPELSRKLSQRLKKEANTQRRRAAEELWNERMETARTQVQDGELWEDVDVDEQTRDTLVARLLNLLQEEGPTYNVTPHLLHHLARPNQDQLQGWIHTALNIMPQQGKRVSERLRSLKEERRQVEKDLQRAPDDELLAPIYEEITTLEAALENLEKQRSETDEKIGAVQFQREEKVRERDQAADKLKAAQDKDRQSDLAERSKLVLRTYQDALTRQRLKMLEDLLVESFNGICRKEQLLEDVHIAPETFEVKLIGADGHVLGVGDLSAGERQLYVMALLQALREVSQRKLPLAIDTPLARLDEIHRQRLLTTYIPAVSRQTILFTTDAELDNTLLQEAMTQLARVYRLSYSAEEDQTLVTSQEATSTNKLISPTAIELENVETKRRVS